MYVDRYEPQQIVRNATAGLYESSRSPQFNHRQEERVSSPAMTTTPFRSTLYTFVHLTAPRTARAIALNTAAAPTGAAASFAHALLRETGTRTRPSGSGRSRSLTLPLVRVVRRSRVSLAYLPTDGHEVRAGKARECSLGSTFALRRRELV